MSSNWNLPPLILHPFGAGGTADEMLEGSRASLALRGLMDTTEEQSELQRRLIVGRYQEIRMLLFLGKDLFRWLQQCVDFCERTADMDLRVSEQSFAAMLVEEPPMVVQEKLEKWGVTDRRAVFSRAIGINSLFNDPPSIETLSPIFLKNYHRFADHAYMCFLHLKPFHPVDAKRFSFEIYASEEYSRLLSDQWEQA